MLSTRSCRPTLQQIAVGQAYKRWVGGLATVIELISAFEQLLYHTYATWLDHALTASTHAHTGSANNDSHKAIHLVELNARLQSLWAARRRHAPYRIYTYVIASTVSWRTRLITGTQAWTPSVNHWWSEWHESQGAPALLLSVYTGRADHVLSLTIVIIAGIVSCAMHTRNTHEKWRRKWSANRWNKSLRARGHRWLTARLVTADSLWPKLHYFKLLLGNKYGHPRGKETHVPLFWKKIKNTNLVPYKFVKLHYLKLPYIRGNFS